MSIIRSEEMVILMIFQDKQITIFRQNKYGNKARGQSTLDLLSRKVILKELSMNSVQIVDGFNDTI